MAETRLVRAEYEYQDGIMEPEVHEMDEYAETGRRLPVELIDAYNTARMTAMRAGEAVMAAWEKAEDEPNPKYVAPEEE